MKLSKRLETIVRFINDDDRVVDVGCDHGYLDIYLALNRKNTTIIATDISKDVIKATMDNINRYKVSNKVTVYCTDGTNNIKEKYDTLVIAGMGSNNIIKIVENSLKVNKLVISSSNNWSTVRKKISTFGYYLSDEILVYENKKLYSIMIFFEGKKRLSFKEVAIGKYNKENIDLYKIYYTEIKKVFNKIPIKQLIKKIRFKLNLIFLKSYLRKKDR